MIKVYTCKECKNHTPCVFMSEEEDPEGPILCPFDIRKNAVYHAV